MNACTYTWPSTRQSFSHWIEFFEEMKEMKPKQNQNQKHIVLWLLPRLVHFVRCSSSVHSFTSTIFIVMTVTVRLVRTYIYPSITHYNQCVLQIICNLNLKRLLYLWVSRLSLLAHIFIYFFLFHLKNTSHRKASH